MTRNMASSAVIGAATLGQAIAEPPQDNDTTRSNYLESSQQRESDKRSQDLDEGTRDHGNTGTSSS